MKFQLDSSKPRIFPNTSSPSTGWNLQSTNFSSIWNNWKYQRLRASVNTRPNGICRACRLPQFDSEKNRAAMQLVPSLKQSLAASAKSLLARRPTPKFHGVMDKAFVPNKQK